MRLPKKHHFCIWCGRALWDGGQSDEHVIPSCLNGRVISEDVCVECNNRFGSESDWRLLHDQRIYEAAVAAGLTPDQFLGNYEGISHTGAGHPVRLKIRGGISRVVGGLGANPVHIASDAAGHFARSDIEQLRALKKSQAKLRLPTMHSTLVETEVDRIIDSLLTAGPAAPAYSPLLGEGFAMDATSHLVNVTRTFCEVDTYRALAKALFTLAKSVLPRTLEKPMAEVMTLLARFAKGEIDQPNPVHFTRLSTPAAQRHRLSASFGATGFRFEVVLFDALSWHFEGHGIARTGGRVTLPDFRWCAVDDASAPDAVIVQLPTR